MARAAQPSVDRHGSFAALPKFLGVSPAVLSGLAAGGSEILVVQPLDMVKTRFQLAASQNPSVLRGLGDVMREGGILRFYRGMVPEVASTVPARTAMYSSYDFTLRKLQACPELFPGCAAFAAGAVSGAPESVVVTPLQLVKVRLQSREHLGRYKHSLDCVQQIARFEGPSSLFRGLEPTLYRNCVWNAAYFWLQSQLREQAICHSILPGPLKTPILAFFAGAFATCFNAPFDVAKSRMQRQLPSVDGEILAYSSTWQTLGRVAREEGIAAMYKGFTPKVLRMATGGAVGMGVFEAAQLLFCDA